MFNQILIIGGGPAGTAAALAAVECGANEVIVVERDAFGGTCTNRGCIPTKFFLTRSEQFLGSDPAARAADWTRAIAHKTALVRGLSRSITERCRSKGIRTVSGTARFVGPHAVEVLGSDGGVTTIESEKIIVATGSRPAELPGSPSDGRAIITSDQALDLDPLPGSLAIVGSGAVGSEFAFIFSRLGVKVTLIEAAPRLFPAEDTDVDPIFRKIYARMGVDIHVGDPVVGIEVRDGGASVAVKLGSGAVVQAARVLVGVGRALESQDLDCGAAGLAVDRRGGIVVDDELRTSQPHILAAGDVTGRALLAHAASYMGEFAGRLAMGSPFPVVPFGSIPWATFTTPEVGAVGMTLDRAQAVGLSAVAASVPIMENVKARIDRTTEGFFKVVVEKGSGRILGGTIVGPHASDMIHVIALAINRGLGASDMLGFSFVHPSISESIGDLFSSLKY